MLSANSDAHRSSHWRHCPTAPSPANIMFRTILMLASVLAATAAVRSHHYESPYDDDYMYRSLEDEMPLCAQNSSKPWCLRDGEYPLYDIAYALDEHYDQVLSLYEDVVVNTPNSVDDLDRIFEETYLCPSRISYIQPLRAVNVQGQWRVIVNSVESYGYVFEQHARIEECELIGPCPLVSTCYESKCVQKNIFHRFLVYDPYDYYFPFAVEKFKLPASCGCVVGAFFP